MIFRANQSTGFYLIGTTAMKELIVLKASEKLNVFWCFQGDQKEKSGRKGLRRIFNLKYVHRLIFFSTTPFNIFHGVLHIIPEIYRATNIYLFKINIETLEKGVEYVHS